MPEIDERGTLVDATWLGVLVAVVLGVPTLYFAVRSFQTGEKSLQFQRRVAREANLAHLQLCNPNDVGPVWRFMSFWPGEVDRTAAYFEAYVRNRGRAVAIDLEFSAFAGERAIDLTGGDSQYLGFLSHTQLVLKIPLAADLSPTAEVVRIRSQWADDDAYHTASWCFRFHGNPEDNPQTWDAVEVDCLSLRPRRGNSSAIGALDPQLVRQ